MSQKPQSNVRRRHVFYVPGYDPMPPRRYRELYRTEGGKQAEICGYALKVQGATGQGVQYHWNVRAEMEDAKTDTKIEFLLWDDIVKQSMQSTILHTYWKLLRTLWLYVRSGALPALYRLRRAPILAAMYPVVVLLGQILFAFFVAKSLAGIIGGIPGLGAGAFVIAGILILFRRLDRRFFAYYLLHDFAFWAQADGRMPQVLMPRVEGFSDRICAALDSEVDEVLIVGHSSGAHLAVVLAAEVLRRRPRAEKLALLTLGQAIPVISFLPNAWDLRRDLRQVSMRPDITWIDVSAPGDGACFALADPVAVSGVAPPYGARFGPKVISAAFTQTLSLETRHKTRWKFFRRHIQYLCAFDTPLEYDYFRITAGPVSLKNRFDARGSSASSIDTVFSPHINTKSRDE
ncbi:MAG: hypothetical protein V3V13_05810 [Paracoccaceae bacterium]